MKSLPPEHDLDRGGHAAVEDLSLRRAVPIRRRRLLDYQEEPDRPGRRLSPAHSDNHRNSADPRRRTRG
jgi:hypothetical protein